MADFFSEILQDESSDEEFEGFSSDEGEISTEPDPETIINDVFMQGWSEGDRQKVNLPFTGRPQGSTQKFVSPKFLLLSTFFNFSSQMKII